MTKKIFLLALFLSLAASVPARAAVLACPSILKSIVSLGEDVDGKAWEIGGPRPFFMLKGGRIFAGPLSVSTIQPGFEVKSIPHIEKVRAISDGVDIYKEIFHQVWDFDGSNKGGLLLVCDYSGTGNFLMRALNTHIRRCTDVAPVDKLDNIPPRVECE